MPLKLVKKNVVVDEVAGFVCDRCKTEHSNLDGRCIIKHRFGYGVELDGQIFEAVLCEKCLAELVTEWPLATIHEPAFSD